MSMVVVVALAIAIMASVAAIGLDDGEPSAVGRGLSAAWNIGHVLPASMSRGG